MHPDKQKYLDPKNDFAFKKIFGSPANKDILIGFLNDVLNHEHIGQVTEVEFLPTIQDPEVAAQKESILDILCRDQHGVQYIIEMQLARTEAFIQRAQYYAAKAFSRQLLSGESYEALKEVIFLGITDFVLFPQKGAIKSDHVIMDKETQSNDLRSLYFTFIELPKFKKGIDELESNTEKWYYYLKHAPETVQETYEKLIQEAPVLARAYQELEKYNWSETELNTYEREQKRILDNASAMRYKLNEAKQEGIQIGKQEGIQIGKEAGIQQEKIEIAKNLLSKNLAEKFISEATGLPLEEVAKLNQGSSIAHLD